MRPPYRVTARPEGEVWVIGAAGVPGEASAPELADVERIARKFIALTTWVPLAEVRVHVTVQTPVDEGHAPGPVVKALELVHDRIHHGVHAPWRWVRDRLDHSA